MKKKLIHWISSLKNGDSQMPRFETLSSDSEGIVLNSSTSVFGWMLTLWNADRP